MDTTDQLRNEVERTQRRAEQTRSEEDIVRFMSAKGALREAMAKRKTES